MNSLTRFFVAPLCAALVLVAAPDNAGAEPGGPQLTVYETLRGNAKLTWVLLDVPPPGRMFQIERRPAGGAWTLIKTTRRRSSWVDRDPLAGRAGYRVRMVVETINYPWSDEAALQPTVPVDCPVEWEAEMLGYVNAARGAGKLRVDARLQNVAHDNSYEMADRNRLGHFDFAGRLALYNYYYSIAGENAVYSSDGPSPDLTLEAFQRWMGSGGHRANILRPEFVDVGVSCTIAWGKRWWTMSFGRPPGY
jgi:uncharacterized protein YkwD